MSSSKPKVPQLEMHLGPWMSLVQVDGTLQVGRY